MTSSILADSRTVKIQQIILVYTFVIYLIYLVFSQPNVQGTKLYWFYFILVFGVSLNGYLIKYYPNYLTSSDRKGWRAVLQTYFVVFFGLDIEDGRVEFHWVVVWIGKVITQFWIEKFTLFLILWYILVDFYLMIVDELKSDEKNDHVGTQEVG